MNSVITRLDLQHLRYLCFAIMFQFYKVLVYFPIVALSTALFGSLIIIYTLVGGKKYTRAIPILWARVNALSAPSTVSVEGKENVDPTQSYVVVANHQSQFDILAIYGWLNVDIRWVMKKELRSVPFLGYACELLGHVIIDRSNHEAALESLNHAKQQLNRGTSIFFFPEGTRSITGELIPFKKGAFILAKELGLPILPVTIKGTHDIMPAKSLHLMPGHADIIIHPPILVDESSNVLELMSQSKEIIASAL